ncbi:MAG: Maff2 family protein [Acetatifactor sp.]|nr:Maff2 family protein [Acetatifactor sp.]
MEFFADAVSTLKIVITAIGSGLGVWGIINLLEGYSNENAGNKSQGIKQLMAGGGVVIVAQTIIPKLVGLFS